MDHDKSRKVKAAVLVKPKKFQIEEFDIPHLGSRDLLIKVDLCGICGSDVHMWEGTLATPKPLIMGHEFIGEVADGGEEALSLRDLKIGDMVSVEIMIPCHRCFWCQQGKYHLCQEDDVSIDINHGRQYGCNIPITRPPTPLWGGYAQYVYVPKDAIVHRFQKRIDPRIGIFTEPLATAIHAVEVSGLKSGNSCVVVGPGTMGLCTVIAAKSSGADPIILIGTSEDRERLKIGKNLGANYIINILEVEDVVAEVKKLTKNRGVDVAIETAGSSAAQLTALRVVRRGGVCVTMGINGQKKLTIVPDNDLVFREVSLRGCKLSPHSYSPAIKIIESKQFPLDRLTTLIFPLSEIDEAFHAVRERRNNVVKVALDPWL